MNWVVVFVLILISLIILYTQSDTLNSALGFTASKESITSCDNTQKRLMPSGISREEYDFDNDGITDDPCDICTNRVSKEKFEQIKADIKGDKLEKFVYALSNNKLDDDGDGVPNACDTEPNKPAKQWLGFSAVKAECTKIQEYSGNQLRVKITKEAGYYTCHISEGII